ncbi:arginase family protein [Cryptosporangium aurantiacum]|uniref:Arginase n=1 Tax=Cryptosporangium aurantiacum TaxID=134849 RepID=A0A1M7HBD6_9ACTN|nr:arginase family protein [Cryptosporangium aurantiacum]SHM25730.1 arginase [Cryptosporangium aurantiacum]
MEIDIVSVPFSATGRAGGAAAAPAAVHAQGLIGRMRSALPTGWTPFETAPVVGGERSLIRSAETGLLNEPALAAMIDGVADAVSASHTDGHFPLLLGGDNPILLGGLVATGHRSDGPAGLLVLSGREAAWPPDKSPTGLASDCTIGLALLAQTNAVLSNGLSRRLPLVPPGAVAVLGARDGAELAAAGIPSLSGSILVRSDQDLGAVGSPPATGPTVARHAIDAIEHIRRTTDSWWLHVDLTVLSTRALPTVDRPLAGGLSWDQLTALTRAALSTPGLVGWSVTGYDADYDLDRTSAARLADYLLASVGALPPAGANGAVRPASALDSLTGTPSPQTVASP